MKNELAKPMVTIGKNGIIEKTEFYLQLIKPYLKLLCYNRPFIDMGGSVLCIYILSQCDRFKCL